MTNKELAAQCLIEAAEILNEAGARQKYLQVNADKQDKLKQQIAREKKLVQHGKSDEKLKDLKDKLLLTDVNKTIYSDEFDPSSVTNEKFRKGYIELNKENKDRFNRFVERESKLPKNKSLHDRINARSKNESIDLLLDEAIELLELED